MNTIGISIIGLISAGKYISPKLKIMLINISISGNQTTAKIIAKKVFIIPFYCNQATGHLIPALIVVCFEKSYSKNKFLK